MRENIGGIKHPAFRDALALTRQGGREASGRYLVEDIDLVRQALNAPVAQVHAVFVASEAAGRELQERCAARDVPLYVLGGSGLITKLIGTPYETAASAVAVVGKATLSPDELLGRLPADALVLAGERIQDPRNVGVLIRTADAVGCAALLLTADSAEPYSRQAVRSTTGSILRLPICLTPDLPATLARLRAEKATRVAVSSGQAQTAAFDADLSGRPLVLVVGNEQDGASRAVIDSATDFVRLPMAADTGADSLNVTVAAGALLYEAVRQRLAAR